VEVSLEEDVATGSTLTGEGKRSNSVLSVLKALQLLETLADARTGLSLSDLSRRNDLHPSTTHRLLHTLAEAGYVRQEASDRNYHLGSAAINLSMAASRHTDMRALAAPYLRQLADATQETASLVILEGEEVVYIAQAESTNTVRTFNTMGARVPAYASASGKALLAHLPLAQQELFGKRGDLPPFTANTLTDPESLQVELERIRRRGYAIDDEEYEGGMRCIAAVIHDHSAEVVAALMLSGPSTRITISRLTDLAQQVQACAAEISHVLGYGARK
jgi:DNA-binding IclR family transcriptional regulator